MDMSQYKLGKLVPKEDPRTLAFETFVIPGQLPPVPDSVSWEDAIPNVIGNWPMMRNDRLGDCTCAAAGHMIECWTANNNNIYVPSDDSMVEAYSAVSGYNPTSFGSDHGAYIMDVMNYWRQTGIAGRQITAFVKLRTGDSDQISQATALFGGSYIGLALPNTAKTQDVWDIDPTFGGTIAGVPGSWGLHAVPVVGYGNLGLTIVTWGDLKRMTWAFWKKYCDEAYAILSPDWFNEDRQAPDGYDVDTLMQDLQIIAGN